MEHTVMELALPQEMAPEDRELSFPDAESFVMDCVSPDEDASSVYQKLMGTIARVTEEISRPDDAEVYAHVKYLSRIAKGLRKNTADNCAFRFFYFGQFQTHVDMLEQELDRDRSEVQILAVANRKHFAPIMQLLYTDQVCQQQELSDKLGIDRSNLSREMQRLLDSGLVDSRTVGRSRYYMLTPQGRRYYDTYLVMKNQLEEQVYSPLQNQDPDTKEAPLQLQNQGSATKEAPLQLFLIETQESPIRFSTDSWQKGPILADVYAKPRAKLANSLFVEG